jgi:AraC-like DNA-binding protein
LPEVFILGLLDKPLQIFSNGKIRAAGIRFYAWGYAELISKNPAMVDNAVPEIFAQGVEIIREYLVNQKFEDCWDKLEKDCRGLLQLYGNRESILHKAFELLRLSNPKIHVSELARECGLSTRHLLRLFKDYLGTSPKALVRNMRFQKARDSLFENPDQSLTQLAYECGFADQSHFIRDFYLFYGKKPSAFVEEMRALRNSISSQPLIRTENS